MTAYSADRTARARGDQRAEGRTRRRRGVPSHRGSRVHPRHHEQLRPARVRRADSEALLSASSRCRSCTTSCTCSSGWPAGHGPERAGARTYLIFGGAVYLVLFLYGLLVGQESAANFVPVNTADDILQLLAIGMIGLGVALTRRRTGATAGTGTVPRNWETSEARARPVHPAGLFVVRCDAIHDPGRTSTSSPAGPARRRPPVGAAGHPRDRTARSAVARCACGGNVTGADRSRGGVPGRCGAGPGRRSHSRSRSQA